MSAVEIGVEDGTIVIALSARDEAGAVTLTRQALTPDEARQIVNGLGEAIRYVGRLPAQKG